MDDRSNSASISIEKLPKPTLIDPNSNTQFKEKPRPLNEDTRQPDADFMTRNIEHIRMASLRNKYRSIHSIYLLFIFI
jgi:hypothetical protein